MRIKTDPGLGHPGSAKALLPGVLNKALSTMLNDPCHQEVLDPDNPADDDRLSLTEANL